MVSTIKANSMIQPQSELSGYIRKLPLRTAKLDGDEVEFEWPHTNKDLMSKLAQNQSKEVKLEKIVPRNIKFKDEQVLIGIKMIFSGDHSEAVNFEPDGSDSVSENVKERKPVKVPARHNGLIVVLVQNECSFKSIYIFDNSSLYSWKKS